jgi:tetratricopeptide (TPR) repeat protein
MAAGVHPFSHAGARRPHELMASVCENDAPPPSAVARFAWKSRLRGDFDKIVETAMHRQPERRYASVEALAADLRRFLSKEPVAARGDGLGYRAGKFLRRRWLPLAAAAAVFASLAAAAMLSAASAREARQQRALAEARRVEAEQQRKFAEEAAQAARMQQAAAEARRVEAERLRLAADAERARSQRNMEAQRALSLNLLSSSDTQFRAGNFQDAIANLERNLEAQRSLARADPGDPHLAKIIGALEVRLCAMRASSGDPKGAVAECKAAIERLAPFAGGGDDLVLASLGAAYSTYGKLKTNPKEAGEAVSHGRKAVQTYEALLAWQPKNPQHQRSLALSRAYLAQGLFMAGDKRQSVATFGQAVDSLQTLIHTNPADTKAVLGFASMLAMQSNMLFKAGDTNEARAAMRHALSLFQALAEAPGATDLEQNEYANWLVRSEFSELWQPGTAIRFAQRAVRSSEERNPGYLDTLAWAYYRNGDVRAAVEAQRKALRVIEANATFLRMPALKKEIEDGLSVFEEALQKK